MIGVVRRLPSMMGPHLGHVSNWSETRLLSLPRTGPALDWDRSPRVADRYHWPCCEGIGGAAFLNAIDGNAMYEAWYRRIWNFVATYFIDRTNGGWYPQLDAGNKPNNDLFSGKPDLYHALQACLIPLLPTTGSITRGLLECGVRL